MASELLHFLNYPVLFCESQTLTEMRKEPFTVGSYVHIVKRGARGLPIVRSNTDRWRFLLTLHHFNDHFHSENWFRDLLDEKISHTLQRASTWPAKNPLVRVEAFTLLTNHFHLILEEIEEGGITRFMHKIGTAMSNHANLKYKQRGSLFQGAYHSRTISDDRYFRYVAAYVMVKNTFEVFSLADRVGASKTSFEEVWQKAIHYSYSSLGYYANSAECPILEQPFLKTLFPTAQSFKSFARDFMEGRAADFPIGKGFE